MTLTTKFDTPASVRDLAASSPFYTQWHNFVAGAIKKETKGERGGAFYNPSKLNVKVVAEKTMVWMGFPRRVLLPQLRDDKKKAYIRADKLRTSRQHSQDEYFEWYIHRKAGKISKVTFVTELHDYYEHLWAFDQNKVLAIYRKFVSPSVMLSDLHNNGRYNILNKWNTTHGILHYTQQINTFKAAIGLAEDLTIANPPASDNYVAEPPYAKTKTSVDPRVCYDVHMLIRKRLHVSFREPIGVYIVGWDNSGITQPNGKPAPASWWKVRRGKKDMVMRLEYEVPINQGFLVGDLEIGGRPIKFGGQLAEQVSVGLVGTAGKKV